MTSPWLESVEPVAAARAGGEQPRLGQVRLAGAHTHRAVPAGVQDRGGPAADLRERAVAAVVDDPRAVGDGGRAAAADGAEQALPGAAQAAYDAFDRRHGVRVGACTGAREPARRLHDKVGRGPARRPGVRAALLARLADLEY